ncbi:MAG: carbohydrate kinase family protein [Actinomycetota bacterium]
MDLLCIGDVMLDVRADAAQLARGGDVHGRVVVQPGGTSANAAVWAVWDGATARVHGGVGADLAGRLVAEALRERGVKMQLTPYPDAATGAMLVLHEPGERSMAADRGANARFRADVLPGMLVSGAVLVSGYLLLHEDTHPTARAAIERSVSPFVAVETASWPLVEAFGVERFFEVTEKATVLLANEREAEVLTGSMGEAAAKLLGDRFPIACVKLGDRGAVAVVDGAMHRAAAEPIEERDPTGAGDAFDGVFLAAVARGADVDDALRRACHAGALAASSFQAWPEEGAR